MEYWKQYMRQDVATSHPIKNTIYIYEKCIGMFRKVKKSYDAFKFSEVDETLDKLEKVFLELDMSVNDEAVYIAEGLHKIYEWINFEIRKIKMTRNASSVPAIEDVLMDLISGYKQIMKEELEGKNEGDKKVE